MASRAIPMPRPLGWHWPAAATVPALLLAAALALRLPHLGDPAFDLDEQWYLVVGERLRGGALPYVDLWDRKPIGLFLLYAGLAWPGWGVIPYQLAAIAAAAGTAMVVARMATTLADSAAGAAAGLAYLVWIETVGGGGGQAPVFYNLLVALAAQMVLVALAAERKAPMQRAASGAMLLVGLALQLKYTVVVEGAWFGLVLAAAATRRLAPPHWPAYVGRLALLALAPTLVALAGYAALGHLRPFWYANFQSIFARGSEPLAAVHTRLGQIGWQFAPFAVCWLTGALALRGAEPAVRQRYRFVLGWLAAALGGFASVGTFFFHYALPLLPPACVAAAPAFRARPLGLVLAALLICLPVAHMDWPDRTTALSHRAAIDRLTGLIPPEVRSRCLQVLDGPPILYAETGACVASRFAFPGHLLSATETHALGADRLGEIDRMFARAPAALVLAEHPYNADPASARRIAAQLAAAYRPVGTVPLDESRFAVWVRR